MIWFRRFTTTTVINYFEDDDEKNASSFFGSTDKLIPRRKEQTQGFLLPLIDMANHDTDPNASFKIINDRWTGKFNEKSTFNLVASRFIESGEQVTISYGDGEETSADLLSRYGFFTEDNPADGRIDWDDMDPQFTTSLEEDEEELSVLATAAGSESARIGRRSILSLRVLLKRLYQRHRV